MNRKAASVDINVDIFVWSLFIYVMLTFNHSDQNKDSQDSSEELIHFWTRSRALTILGLLSHTPTGRL